MLRRLMLMDLLGAVTLWTGFFVWLVYHLRKTDA